MPAIGIRPWTPKLIPTVGWYDAADGSTVWEDVAGTTPAGASSQVRRWDDKSGNGHHLTQAGGNTPQWGFPGVQIDGKNVMDYATTTDQLYKDSIPDINCTQLAHIGVIMGESGDFPAVGALFKTDNSDLLDHRYSSNALNGAIRTAFTLDGASTSQSGPNEDGLRELVPFISSFWYDGDVIVTRANGGVYTEQDDVADGGTFTINKIQVGRQSNTPQNYQGELIILDTADLATIQLVEGYLAHKWGLAANLPEDHPYRYRPPIDSSLDTEDWDPTSIVTAAWFDAADQSTVIDTTDPGFVEQWSDKSGNGRHLLQTVLSKKPATETRAINGRNALDFNNAVDSGMRLDLGASIGDTHEIYCAINKDDLSGSRTLFHITEVGQSWYMDEYGYGGYGYRGVVSPSGGGAQFGTIRNVPDQIMVGYDGLGFYRYVNGAQDGAKTNTPGTLPVDRISIGMNGFGNNSFDGLVGEVIIVPPQTVEGRQRIEGYLAHKWGLTANLPANHPYKTKKPQRTKLWTPNEITTACWYDAADDTTITEAGGAVSQWDDKSGNGNHATQATEANKPITGTRIIGGLNVLDFDGTDDSISNNALVGLGTTDKAMVMVVQSDVVANKRPVQMFAGAGAGQMFFYNSGASAYVATDGIKTFNVSQDTNPHIIAMGKDDNGDAFYNRDGATPATQSSGPGLYPYTINIGHGTFDGRIAEAIYLDALDTTTRQKIEGYLAWKWGFPHQLPATHPYKKRPPMI